MLVVLMLVVVVGIGGDGVFCCSCLYIECPQASSLSSIDGGSVSLV